VASIAGPPVAGLVIVLAGTGAAFTVDAVSFFVAAIVILLMARPDIPGAVSTSAGHAADQPQAASFGEELRAGVRYVAADPAIRTLMLIALVLNFALNGPAAVGMAWLADRRFDAGPSGLGLMAAGWAAGALVGTLVAGNARLDHQGRALLGAVVAAGAMMVAVGVLVGLAGVVAALAVMGVAIGYVNIVAISWIQARVDPAMVGRVMSLVMLMSFGITPLSLALAGVLIDLDATALFVGAGVLTMLTALFAGLVGLPAMLDGATPAGAVDGQPGPAATQ